MTLTKEKAKENLAKLIEKFEKELTSGRAQEYNEEETKKSFIEPLLEDVLGWDTRNHDEVSFEKTISRGRVDYGLKIESKIKVFIEAKPIRADLGKHIEQAVGYGYNRKDVPFVLLTDFEGIKLFDVTIKPDLRNPAKGLKIDLSWQDYLKNFDKLWFLSKESVAGGALDKLLVAKPKERHTVDKAILDDLKEWRELLAKDIFKNNSKLFESRDKENDAHYLKEITQEILDRIIFIRSCEDRNLVHSRSLKEVFEERSESEGLNAMLFLEEEFKQYNRIFDSDLFRPQDWEDSLVIDFKVMLGIILETYNPYQFDVIPIEVLGNIYEQYLGYTIRISGNQIKYELKPDVRKAGGVYYTPEYIVDYIVRNTVGKLLHELPPNKIKKLRILDPACGSGSFLIRAYEEMLHYYRNQKKLKAKSKERGEELNLLHKEYESRLSIHEKSQILRQHIFGVDIDEQAVEVTKLSLMLKMLEGEYGFVPGQALLPVLDRNIRCGNSLISGDTLELKKYFGDDYYKVKPLNWEKEFPEIMVKEGGFDAVVGNPPYGAEMPELEKQYLQYRFTASQRNNNSYVMFLALAIELAKKKGAFGFITPTTFLTGDNFIKLREILLAQNIYQIIKLPYNVFVDAYIDTCICLVRKETFKKKVEVANILPKVKIDSCAEIQPFLKQIDKTYWKEEKNYNFVVSEYVLPIKRRILNSSVTKLGDISKIDRGTLPPKNISHAKVNNENIFYWFEGQVYRYILQDKFVNRVDCEDLKEFKSSEMFKGERILLRQLISRQFRINATITNKPFAFKKNLYCIYDKTSNMNLKYILAIINSKLLSFYIYNSISGMQKDDFPSLSLADARSLPIRKIDFSDTLEKKIHSNIINLVDIMLNLNKKLHSAKGSEKELIQRQIDKTDREIDDFVYKLYGITEKERKIIEER